MSQNIPKSIQDEFQIISSNIKYPTYKDLDFENSILDDANLNNYSEENKKRAFEEFFSLLKNCKNNFFEIMEKNMHNFQEYCESLEQKTFIFLLHFNIIEKIAILVEKKYFKTPLTEKEIFCDDLVFEITNSNETFKKIYNKEFKDQNQISLISKNINPIIERYNKLLNHEKESGNIVIRAIKYVSKYLFTPMLEELNNFKKIEQFHEKDFFKTNINEENEISILNIILYLQKLSYLDFGLYNSAILDADNICNLDENSNEWNNLKKIFFRLVPKNSEEIKKGLDEQKGNPELGFSIMSNIQPNESATSIIFSGVKNYFYYRRNENRAKIDSKRYRITYNIDKIKELAGLFKTFKPIFLKFIPNIEFRRKIYVKKELPPINKMYIKKLINYTKGENVPINSELNKNNNENNNIESLPIIYRDKVPDKAIKRNYVSVTILFTEKIYFKDEKKEEGFFSSFFKSFNQKNESSINTQIDNKFRKNTIMITIHGGGFIASSTLFHERYLRKWEKCLNVPIFGINYSLAPEYPYPEALNDVYQAYIWILKHAKEELNMDIKHIILSGDSAGANIALGLYHLLIVIKDFEKQLGKEIILPELLLAQYPAVFIDLKNYSNSFLLSLDDPMLNFNGMKYMCEKYVGNYPFSEEDPFLNPIKINDFILDRIKAKIRICFGSRDVLREDGLRLLDIYSRYNNRDQNKNIIDARGFDILYMGHGFNGRDEKSQKISRDIIMPEIEEFLNNIN